MGCAWRRDAICVRMAVRCGARRCAALRYAAWCGVAAMMAAHMIQIDLHTCSPAREAPCSQLRARLAERHLKCALAVAPSGLHCVGAGGVGGWFVIEMCGRWAGLRFARASKLALAEPACAPSPRILCKPFAGQAQADLPRQRTRLANDQLRRVCGMEAGPSAWLPRALPGRTAQLR